MGDNGCKLTSSLSQKTLFFSVVVIESLVILPCIIFTIINYVTFDSDSYKLYHQDFSKIIAFHLLAPLLVVQALWLLTNILASLAVHTTVPYLILPNLCIVIIGLIICLVMIGPSVDCLIRSDSDVKWPMIAFVVGLAIFVILLFIFIAIRVAAFRMLVKKKKVVQGTSEKEAPEQIEAPPPAPDPEVSSTTFSRRSTMSITDERYAPPPRI